MNPHISNAPPALKIEASPREQRRLRQKGVDIKAAYYAALQEHRAAETRFDVLKPEYVADDASDDDVEVWAKETEDAAEVSGLNAYYRAMRVAEENLLAWGEEVIKKYHPSRYPRVKPTFENAYSSAKMHGALIQTLLRLEV